MTLLGSGFQMGQASTPATLDLSLDDMIRSRAKPAASTKKGVSNADRSIATSRAKRKAVVNARRGITSSTKASRMDIDKEVTKQANKTAIKKANKLQKSQQQQPRGAVANKKKQLSGKEQAALRKNERDVRAAGRKAAKAENVSLAPKLPTKKQYKAGKAAIMEAGYTLPKGHEIVITVQPKAAHANKKKGGANTTPKSNKQNNNNNPRYGGGGKKK